MANTFAYAETRGGELRRVALEAVTAARQLADASGGGEVHALIVGAQGVAAKAEQLARYGADLVTTVEDSALDKYSPEVVAATAAQLIGAGDYRVAVFSASAQGKDLAPRVAAKLGVSMISDATSLEVNGDSVVSHHPVNTGKVIATVTLTGTPALVTIRPGAVTPVESNRSARVQSGKPAIDPASARVVPKELIQGSTAQLDLGEAPVVVSGGRGLKVPENFKLLEDLAAAFGNAAVGATRAVTDEGWRPHSDQIGQTGRLVSPDLYIACGISGAIQHLAGMRTSRTIVAINRDREAPIFKIADYGIVGDALEIVPVLTEAVKKAKQE
jgi:Electron transfer flavoprotein, alpha subunit